MHLKQLVLFFTASLTLIACGGSGGGTPSPAKVNQAPIAKVSITNNEYKLGEDIEVNANESSDPEQDTLTYQWKVTNPSGEYLALDDSAQKALSFVVETEGDYIIELTVFDSKGAQNKKTETLTVKSGNNHLPVAAIKITPENLVLGDEVTLSAGESSDEDGDELSYLWQVVDPLGQFIEFIVNSSESLNFTPSKHGTYTVTLTVSDSANGINKTEASFNVSDVINEKIFAKITGNKDVKQSNTVLLNGEESILLHDTNFIWQLIKKPENSVASLASNNDVNTQFIADQAGDYQVNLKIEDSEGNTDETSFTVTASTVIENSAPVAVITADKNSVALGQKFNLSGKASSDADGEQLSYRWQVTSAPDNANYNVSQSQSMETEFYSNTLGNYEITLEVSDGELKSSKTIQLVILQRNTVPVTGINVNSLTPQQGETITFSGVALDNESDELIYQWQLLSKPNDSTTELSTPKLINTQLYLDKSGDYLVSFIASDNELSSEPVTKVVKASVNHAPVITGVNYSIQIKTGVPTNLSVNATDPEGQPLTYTWQITKKDAGTSAVFSNTTEAATEFTANDAGWYTISVSVNDGIQEALLPTTFILIVTD